VECDGDLAAGLVDPGADLGRLVDGDAGGYDNGRGDDDACGERVVRSSGGALGWRGGSHAGSCKQVGQSKETTWDGNAQREAVAPK